MVDDPNKIIMVREDLDDIPVFELPNGYFIRWFEPGDEVIWMDIQKAVDKLNEITPELFAKTYGTDAAVLHERIFFVLDDKGEPVATSSAWFNDDFHGKRYGRVHWVAVLPESQNKGLGKCLMTITLQRLKELAHTNAYLSTDKRRPNAVRLYGRFGFVSYKP